MFCYLLKRLVGSRFVCLIVLGLVFTVGESSGAAGAESQEWLDEEFLEAVDEVEEGGV